MKAIPALLLIAIVLTGCPSAPDVITGDLIDSQNDLTQAVDTVVTTTDDVVTGATNIADKYKTDAEVQAHKAKVDQLSREVKDLEAANNRAREDVIKTANLAGKYQGQLAEEKTAHEKTRGQRNVAVVCTAALLGTIAIAVYLKLR